MSQVGRISGPLLQENLERNGIDLAFRNTSGQTQLLYLDVNSGRIGINKGVTGYELDTSGTTKTTELLSTTADIDQFEFRTTNINVLVGDINLSAPLAIKLSNFETDNIHISDNSISSFRSNSAIDLIPNGSGIVDSFANLEVYGSLHSNQNITLDGTVTFGDTVIQDTITFEADINSDLIPDANNTYELGSTSKRWNLFDSQIVNGNRINVDVVQSGTSSFGKRTGNSFYVAVNGNDSNAGDHPNGPFATLKRALQASDASIQGPVTIRVMAGEYQEDLPLTVPSNVSVIGEDMRNTIITPDTGTQSSDVFLLNGESTVQNLTIKGFYSPGYAFRFAPNAVVSTRSPYIQNVTVITQGTPITVTASSTFSVNSQETHPRGITFNNDGTKMFIVGEIGDDVNEYTLSTGFDLSSIVTFVDSFAVTQCPNPTAVKFNADGTKMFVTGTTNDNVHQYALTTGFDVSSASFTQTLVTTVDSDNFGLDFKPDGTKMYITGNQNNKIYEYNLSSAFDISSATFNQDLTLTAIDSEPFGIEWSTDGTRLFIVGTRGNGVDEFAVGTPYDISTLTHIGFYSIGGNPSGIHISPDGTKMFIIGNQSDTVKSYDLSVSYRIKVPTDDPRGFAQGDAGGGAYIDGASVNSASNEAAMLFHSSTFITPGVDTITMTNGVRVEWLNSFTYFANRGLYAVDGVTGHLSTDGSTVKYGAELRAIGSANVYGNYGAVADGADTLMYLVQHNMAYIGSGKFLDNDPSRVIQTQEVTELNSGNIYFSTTDHLGNFRVGDNFFVDLESGETSLVLTEAQVDSLGGLNITTGANTTVVDGTKIETGNLRFSGNTILSTLDDINIASDNGLIDLTSDTYVSNNLDISGNLSFGGNISLLGDQTTDIVNFNVDFDQSINPNQNGIFSLGTTSKRWINTQGNKAYFGDVLFYNNYVTTFVSNADLELRANGTGKIYVPNNDLEITNNLAVDGITNLQDLNTNSFVLANNLNISTNFATTNLTVENLTVGSQAQFEEINIDGNVITTTTSNTDLELRANSTGNIFIPTEDILISNDLDVQGTWNASDLNVNTQVIATQFDNNTINITSNIIKTDISNADLELRATGNVTLNDSLSVTNDFTVQDTSTLVDTAINGLLTHSGTFNQTGNRTITGDLDITASLDISAAVQFEEILIDDNYITTTSTNADLDLRASGSGQVRVPNNNVNITNNLSLGTLNASTINIDNEFELENMVSSTDIEIFDNVITTTNSNSDLELRANGTGNKVLENILLNQNTLSTLSTSLLFAPSESVIITSSSALLIPVGTTAQRPAAADVFIDGGLASPLGTLLDGGSASTIFGSEDTFYNSGGSILATSGNTGDIRFNSTDNIFESTGNSTITFNGVYSSDRLTSLIAHPTNNTLIFKSNNVQVGTVNSTGITLHGLEVDDITINQATITTNVSNSDLELEANGNGNTIIDDFEFSGSTITNTNSSNANLRIYGTGTHLVQFAGNHAVRFPSGTTAQRPAAPQLGLTRQNTDDDILETWDGDQWIPSAGLTDNVSEPEMQDISLAQTLIYG
jgi:sugar lactone lactonase YvrE